MTIQTKEALAFPLIENTTVIRYCEDGTLKVYGITPNDGYVLHDNMLDNVIFNSDDHEPTGEVVLRYYKGTRTVAANYDFIENPRGFYAVAQKDIAPELIV